MLLSNLVFLYIYIYVSLFITKTIISIMLFWLHAFKTCGLTSYKLNILITQ